MKFIITSILLFCANIIFAQTPQAINYQAVARDASNNLLVNKNIGVRISILSGSATGTNVYSETHITTTNASGIFSLEIGRGNIVSGNFPNIQWYAQPHFAKIEIDANSGTNYQLVGTSQFLSVPYALFAENTAMIYKVIPLFYSSDTITIKQGFGQTLTSVGGQIEYIGGEPEPIVVTSNGFNNYIKPIQTYPYTITATQFENSNSIGAGDIKIDSLTPIGIYPITITGTNSRGRQKSKTSYINISDCNINSENDFVGMYIGSYLGGVFNDTITITNPINGDNFLNLISKSLVVSSTALRNINTLSGNFSNISATNGSIVITNASGKYKGILCNNELTFSVIFTSGTFNSGLIQLNIPYTGVFRR